MFGREWLPLWGKTTGKMKKRILFLALAALLGLAMPAVAQDWGGFAKYAEENAALLAAGAPRPRAVLIGDSITRGWYKHRESFFTDHGYVGRGISGQVSLQMLVRFSQDVLALRPEIVVINAGTNDVAENQGTYDEDRTFDSIVAMVRLAQADGIKPILTSVLPATGFRWNRNVTDAAEKIVSLNARLRDFAAAEKLLYVDYFSALVSTDGFSPAAAFFRDGVHPLPEGYEVMEPLVVKAIEQAHSSRRYGRLRRR